MWVVLWSLHPPKDIEDPDVVDGDEGGEVR